MKNTSIRVGNIVTYVPDHAAGNIHDDSCQTGVVTTVKGDPPFIQVWVKFKGPNGELTPVRNLVVHPREN